jgi:hypothetical protein
MRRVSVVIVVALVVSGCTNQGLRQLQSNSEGPDEFLVDPKLELEIPEDMAALPPPTPGQANRTDPDTYGDFITALGGSAGSATAAIPSSDGALVTAASRFGVTQDIRATLAAEDDALGSWPYLPVAVHAAAGWLGNVLCCRFCGELV